MMMEPPGDRASPVAAGHRSGHARELHRNLSTARGRSAPTAMTVAQSRLGGRLSLEGLFKRLGPGVITGAADDDPSGIATYSQAGAQTGFGLLWTVVLTWPLMVAVQSVSARIGRVTGRGLAGNMMQVFPRSVVTVLVAAAVRRQHHQYRRRPRRHGRGRAAGGRAGNAAPLYRRLRARSRCWRSCSCPIIAMSAS